jgi:hypothetical protein
VSLFFLKLQIYIYINKLGEILAQEVQKKAPQGVTGAINAKVCAQI